MKNLLTYVIVTGFMYGLVAGAARAAGRVEGFYRRNNK